MSGSTARSTRAIACRRQERHQDVTNRHRNAMNTTATRDNTIADIPFERPACFPIREDGGAHVRRRRLEFLEDLLRHFFS